ncbi:nucleotidyltransferase family protein [Natronococcus sp. A-GB7]|uniref:nucleotidyltransferase domain-containing protein n=1 Tax=Natronococcus sp. A-GB7 TaxID=3037649 RepID=UPI00241D27ED|nr:nucleotidyltransferase family protein [Natronococcus sp. A-GB7]MDG5819712.1 nucleotidyltransferase family protein [Natronococcus sp. A-GB7]
MSTADIDTPFARPEDALQRPEHRFLLRCVRQTTHDVPRVEPPAADEFDWEYFRRLANDHRLASLVNRCLTDEAKAAIPDAVVADFESIAEWVTYRNLGMIGTTRAVLSLLEARGISALPYKGPVLAAVVHGDLAFRGSKDVDVLLPKAEISAARETLLANGFRPKDPSAIGTEPGEMGSNRHSTVVSEDDIRVELHWRITGNRFPFAVDFERLWRTRETADVGGTTMPIPSLDELVVPLAVHGNRHCWSELAWLCDFAGTVDARDFDWGDRLRAASDLGAKRMLLVGLGLVDLLTDVELPPIVRRHLRSDRVANELSKAVVTSFLWTAAPSTLATVRYMLRVRERPTDTLRAVARLALLPGRKDFELLPPRARYYPLAVACRPIRIAGTAGTNAAGRFR